MADDEEKTEQPTGKKTSEARQQGQVPKSMELNSVAILVVGFWSLYIYRLDLYEGLVNMMQLLFQESTRTVLSVANFQYYTISGAYWLIKLIGPIFLIIAITGIVINFLQVGWLVTFKPLTPNLSKINPLSGLKNLFSMDKVINLVKEILKLVVIGGIAYWTLKDQMAQYLVLNSYTTEGILIFMFSTIFWLTIRIAMALLILAIIDWFYQRYRVNKQLRMTKQEVKDERRQMDGDPQLKAKVRSLQVEMAQRRMMGEVPKATVVLTNPTFIAIALRYEIGVDKAPVVLAKGKRKTAERIREIAKEHDIPIVEDKPLARGMYDIIEVGQEIPKDYFTPVAEILAYVYKLKGKAA